MIFCLTTSALALLQPTAFTFKPRVSVHRASNVVAQYQQQYDHHQQYDQHGYAEPQAAQLPWPWEQRMDEHGQVYYANPETQVTSWDPPSADDYAYAHQQQQQQYAQDDYGRDGNGQLDFELYRMMMRERGEPLTDRQLREKFDELNQYAQQPDLYEMIEKENDLYGNEMDYNGGRGQYADAPYQGGAYNYRAQQSRVSTPLLEFLRWQEWYVKYCKLRNINVPNRG